MGELCSRWSCSANWALRVLSFSIRFLIGLSCSHTASGGAAGGAARGAAAGRALAAGLAGALGLAAALGLVAWLGLGCGWAGRALALARAGLSGAAGTSRGSVLGALAGVIFWMLSGAGLGASGALVFLTLLRCATLVPSAILTAWGLSLRTSVDFFTACSCAVFGAMSWVLWLVALLGPRQGHRCRGRLGCCWARALRWAAAWAVSGWAWVVQHRRLRVAARA